MITEAASRAAAPFFHHAAKGAASSGQPLQNATRHLAAGVYLDKRLCDRVLAEYIEDEHRAVVPSFGFDLEPVILHALRARRLRLVRDVTLALVWVAAWILLPLVTTGLLVLGINLAVLYLVPWSRLRWRWRLLVAWLILFVVMPVVAFVVTAFSQLSDGDSESSSFEQSSDPGLLDSLDTERSGLMALLVIACFTLVVIGHLAVVFRILARELGPGASGPSPRTYSARVHGLLERISSAQRGNVTLYSGDNPFIGAGDAKAPWAKAWSIVLELDRPASGGLLTKENGEDVRADPVVMHQRIRARLQEMRDEWPPGETERDPMRWLPPHERIAGLVTDVHIVGRGECMQRDRALDAFSGRTFRGHPLIDPRGGVPYSVATREAIDAIMRHPQGGVRCYQRVMVGAQGQAIMGRDDRPLAPAEDQDIALSAFVYLAVEGHMLYGQFVATVLPPIRREFRMVDVLPSWGVPTLLGRSLQVGWRRVLSASMLAWPRLAATGWQMGRGALAAASGGDPSRELVHDYGARISVRELAADRDFHTFLQELDAEKYTRLIERRVNEALLDYLEDECRIDVSAYRAQASTILNTGVIMTGGEVSGQIAVGGQGTRVQQTQSGIDP
ncbi:hypothetical protein [Spirillospora sp. CA-294931]|uniref:hypothetical protein n=1 Tax=Spirillospora sp. CA-294931 TaxID=3240042 RepID=UPI003D8CC18B